MRAAASRAGGRGRPGYSHPFPCGSGSRQSSRADRSASACARSPRWSTREDQTDPPPMSPVWVRFRSIARSVRGPPRIPFRHELDGSFSSPRHGLRIDAVVFGVCTDELHEYASELKRYVDDQAIFIAAENVSI